MTKHEQAEEFLPPYAAESRRRAGGFGRLTGDVRGRARGRMTGSGAPTKPPLTPDQLSSYIAVNADGIVAYSGKMDMGQGFRSPSNRSSRRSSTFPTRA